MRPAARLVEPNLGASKGNRNERADRAKLGLPYTCTPGSVSDPLCSAGRGEKKAEAQGEEDADGEEEELRLFRLEVVRGGKGFRRRRGASSKELPGSMTRPGPARSFYAII